MLPLGSIFQQGGRLLMTIGVGLFLGYVLLMLGSYLIGSCHRVLSNLFTKKSETIVSVGREHT